MADLESLTALYAWCQERNLRPRALSVGGLRVELGGEEPRPRSVPVADHEPPAVADPKDAARRSLEVLMHSSGADVETLMSRLG